MKIGVRFYARLLVFGACTSQRAGSETYCSGSPVRMGGNQAGPESVAKRHHRRKRQATCHSRVVEHLFPIIYTQGFNSREIEEMIGYLRKNG